MRVLITGGSGLLGRCLIDAFQDAKWEVTATALTRFQENNPIFRLLDLADEKAIVDLVKEINPHIIVHSAAIRNVDVCANDEELTNKINVRATAILAKLAAELPDTFLIYISTDYVFDGKNPPFKPNSPTNPLNKYGKSKLEGEKAIWAIENTSAGVLRVPLLYGEITSLQESGVTCLIKSLQINTPAGERKVEKVDNYQIRYPTYTKDVALCVKNLAERRMRHCSLSGTWHFSGNEAMTKYQMCLRLGQLLNTPTNHIHPIDAPPDGQHNERPLNAQLDCASIEAMSFLKVLFRL